MSPFLSSTPTSLPAAFTSNIAWKILTKNLVLPIGEAQVDSVVPLVRAKGDTSQPAFPFLVQKGDPLAYFQLGGSDIIVAFQAKAGMTGILIEPD
jgi:hypothetical protein